MRATGSIVHVCSFFLSFLDYPPSRPHARDLTDDALPMLFLHTDDVTAAQVVTWAATICAQKRIHWHWAGHCT